MVIRPRSTNRSNQILGGGSGRVGGRGRRVAVRGSLCGTFEGEIALSDALRQSGTLIAVRGATRASDGMIALFDATRRRRRAIDFRGDARRFLDRGDEIGRQLSVMAFSVLVLA